MSIIRVHKDERYFVASNEPFNDQRLSWEARGVMGYLLSKPDGWTIREQNLINEGPAGEHKIKRVIKELKECGYLHRHRVRVEDGTFTWNTEIYESPSLNPYAACQQTTKGLTTSGSSTSGKPPHIVKTESVKTEEVKRHTSANDAEATPKPKKLTPHTRTKNAIAYCLGSDPDSEILPERSWKEIEQTSKILRDGYEKQGKSVDDLIDDMRAYYEERKHRNQQAVARGRTAWWPGDCGKLREELVKFTRARQTIQAASKQECRVLPDGTRQVWLGAGIGWGAQ